MQLRYIIIYTIIIIFGYIWIGLLSYVIEHGVTSFDKLSLKERWLAILWPVSTIMILVELITNGLSIIGNSFRLLFTKLKSLD